MHCAFIQSVRHYNREEKKLHLFESHICTLQILLKNLLIVLLYRPTTDVLSRLHRPTTAIGNLSIHKSKVNGIF